MSFLVESKITQHSKRCYGRSRSRCHVLSGDVYCAGTVAQVRSAKRRSFRGLAGVTVDGSKETLQGDLFFVVVNHEEQYSIWSESRAVPKGWKVVGEPAPKHECLARIEELWTDMRPLSVRTHLQATATREPQ